jgi:hypothetical protein
VAQKCLSKGTPDPACVYGCANGNQQALQQVLDVFLCVISKCGKDCAGVLSGGGGGLGG